MVFMGARASCPHHVNWWDAFPKGSKVIGDLGQDYTVDKHDMMPLNDFHRRIVQTKG